MTFLFLELNGTTRRIKKQNAKKLIHSGAYEQIGERSYRAIERRGEKRGLEVIEVAFCDFNYPIQLDHPELQLIPAMRYPVEIARQGLTSFA